MIKNPISTSYARALLELARERSELEQVLEEVRFLLSLYREDADFRNLVLTPGIEPHQKAGVLDRVFRDRLSALVSDFLQVVIVEKGRGAFLEEILGEFVDLVDREEGRIHVEAVTATPLGDEQAEGLRSALATKLGKTVLLDQGVDAEILGGLIIRYGDWVIDGSVRTRLRSIAYRLAANKPGSEFVHEDQA